MDRDLLAFLHIIERMRILVMNKLLRAIKELNLVGCKLLALVVKVPIRFHALNNGYDSVKYNGAAF